MFTGKFLHFFGEAIGHPDQTFEILQLPPVAYPDVQHSGETTLKKIMFNYCKTSYGIQ